MFLESKANQKASNFRPDCFSKANDQIKSFIILGCIAPKRVTNLRVLSPRHSARAAQLLSKKCGSKQGLREGVQGVHRTRARKS